MADARNRHHGFVVFFTTLCLILCAAAKDALAREDSSESDELDESSLMRAADAMNVNLPPISQQTTTNDVIDNKNLSLMLITVATEEPDAFNILRRSAVQYGHNLTVFGKGENGSATATTHSLGYEKPWNQFDKITIIHKALAPYKHREDLMILFCDGYDSIVNADERTILERYHQHFPDKRVVFSADVNSWPDIEFGAEYPPVKRGSRYLNSGIYMGYAPTLYELLSLAVDYAKKFDKDDDQDVLAHLYVNDKIRESLKLGIDHVFNMIISMEEIYHGFELKWGDDGFAVPYFRPFDTYPIVLQGNGGSRVEFVAQSNYLGKEYNIKTGRCRTCPGGQDYEAQTANVAKNVDELPFVHLALFITTPAIHHLHKFLRYMHAQSYPKQRLHLFIFNNIDEQSDAALVEQFVREHRREYASVWVEKKQRKSAPSTTSDAADDYDEAQQAKVTAIEHATNLRADFMFIVNSDAHLYNPRALELLVERSQRTKYGIIAPLLTYHPRHGSRNVRANFWGFKPHLPHEVTDFTVYMQRADYPAIVSGERRGTWNVFYVRSAMLVASEKFSRLQNAYRRAIAKKAAGHLNATEEEEDDIALSKYRNNARTLYHLFVDNTHYYGHLVKERANEHKLLIEDKKYAPLEASGDNDAEQQNTSDSARPSSKMRAEAEGRKNNDFYRYFEKHYLEFDKRINKSQPILDKYAHLFPPAVQFNGLSD